MTKVILVDRGDAEVGVKERGNLSYQDIYRIAALWITNSKGEVLMAQRKLSKKHNPGRWGPGVSGTVEEGETYESNIYKEAEEEIGLTGCNLKKGPKVYIDDGVQKFYVQWFLCQLENDLEDFCIQEEEVEQIKWMSISDLTADVEKNPDRYASAASWKQFLHI